VLSFYQLYSIIKDSQDHSFVIYGINQRAEKIYNILTMLDIEPLYFVIDNNTEDFSSPVPIPSKSVYDLLYEDLTKIVVLLYEYDERAVDILVGIGLDFQRNIRLFSSYRERLQLHVEYSLDVILGYISQKTYKGIRGFSGFGSDDAQIKILTLGGSTTANDAYDCVSWSELLQRKLDANGYSVLVICGGVSGYSLYQEMNLLIRDGLLYKPDIVVDFSGINQICYNEDNLNIQPYQKFIFSKLHINNTDGPWQNTNMAPTVNYGAKTDETFYMNYKRLLRIMNSICMGEDIRFISYFQPNITYKLHNLNLQEKEMRMNHVKQLGYNQFLTVESEKFRREMLYDDEPLVFQTDLSRIFDEIGDVYYDYVHVYEKGNEIIAEHVMQDLLKRKYL